MKEVIKMKNALREREREKEKGKGERESEREKTDGRPQKGKCRLFARRGGIRQPMSPNTQYSGGKLRNLWRSRDLWRPRIYS